MIAYDAFCGAGNASNGLTEAGYDVIGFDIWPTACESHAANGHRTVCADLERWHWRGRCDLLWGSPPCQPFSAAGDHEGVDDERDGMPAFLRAVAELRAPIVVMENVKGLTFEKHAPYFGTVIRDLRGLGYDVDWRVLNCADFGVPQTRERLIVIARNDGGPLRWPSITHTEGDSLFLAPWVSMAEALGFGMTERPYPTIASSRTTGGPDKEKVGGSGARSILYDAQAAGAWVLNTGRDWKPGGTRDDAQVIDIEDRPAPAVPGAHGGASIWHLTRPATTIAGDSRVWPPGHKENGEDPPGKYAQRRGEDAFRITVEQAARLQDFPEGYVFKGNRTAQFQQIGNACPKTLVRVVVEALR